MIQDSYISNVETVEYFVKVIRNFNDWKIVVYEVLLFTLARLDRVGQSNGINPRKIIARKLSAVLC